MDAQETELIRRCLLGDEAAFQALHAAHARYVMAYFLRSGFARPQAEDLTQETFLRGFRALATFDPGKGALRPWLGAIARNVARKRWSGRREERDFDPDLAEEVFAAPGNPSEAAETAEEIQAVRAGVAALPEELARVVRLRYVEGRTTRGIAAATGIPEATVRLRLKEALATLAEHLRRKGLVE